MKSNKMNFKKSKSILLAIAFFWMCDISISCSSPAKQGATDSAHAKAEAKGEATYTEKPYFVFKEVKEEE